MTIEGPTSSCFYPPAIILIITVIAFNLIS
jgi:hypothetical protein